MSQVPHPHHWRAGTNAEGALSEPDGGNHGPFGKMMVR